MNGSFNHFPQLAAALKPAVQSAVGKTVQDMEHMAEGLAAVDTGFMQESVYSVSPDGTSTYGATPTRPDSYLFPEVAPDDDMTGILGVGANYGEYVDKGTRFMPAQPFFTPAVAAGPALLDGHLATEIEDAWGSI